MLNKILKAILFLSLLITPVYAQWTGVFNPGLLKSGTVASTNFPVVQSTNTTFGVATGIHNLPTGIVSGDLLLLNYQSGTTTVPSAPAGWTQLYNQGTPTNNQRGAIFYRVANGSEGSTVTVSGGATQSSITYRIDTYTGVPEIASTSGASGTNNPDPPNLTPSWGLYKNLWLALGWVNFASISGTPSGYLNTITIASRLTSSQRQLLAASENPTNYTQTSSASWLGVTLGVKGN